MLMLGYHERQRGGLCRMHALNAYFNYAKYNEISFKKLCEDFDNDLKVKGYHLNCSSLNFDGINSNQETVVSFALKEEKKSFIYVPINMLSNILSERNLSLNLDDINRLIGDENFIFVFNQNHIFGCRKVNNNWYVIDSLAMGPQPTNLLSYANLGFIFPRNKIQMSDDLKFYMNQLKNSLETNDEIILGRIIDIFEITYQCDRRELIDKYYVSLKEFENRQIKSFDQIKNIILNFKALVI